MIKRAVGIGAAETVRVPVAILGGGPVGLLLSSLLSSYGIRHCLVERRLSPTKHPQAHFMNARTMEILQCHLPDAMIKVCQQMPSPDYWRDFVYSYSVIGREYARVDHFKDTDGRFWEESPTNVVHLPQHKFEVILREHLRRRNDVPTSSRAAGQTSVAQYLVL
jgi:2-polyprenyl-6-methoxyphenol hydroxylase-like FAD-dependent oxidoreductase